MLCLKVGFRAALGLMWASFALLAVASASAQVSSSVPSVDMIRQALDQARFEDAAHLAQSLLAQASISARDRNDALELLAIVQIAQRNSDRAGETLKLLFDRDAEHPQRVHDPGPAVDAAIARARRLMRSPATVVMKANARRDAYGRELLDIEVGEGRDRVDTLHVFVRAERDAHFTELVHHLAVDDTVTLLLPSAPLGASHYNWFIEARAPSGLLLSHLADRNAPLETALLARPATPTCKPVKAVAPVHVHERWWLWTSVGVAIAGVAVGAAIAAQ